MGDPENLTDLSVVTQRVKGHDRRFRVCPGRFWRVWESRDAVLAGAGLLDVPDQVLLDFAKLETRLLRQFFRLLAHERRLFHFARRGRNSGGGRTAIRQIEFERQRLGSELHTGVGQTLVAIGVQIEVISTELPLPPPRVQHALDSITALARGALGQVRSVSRKLHPPEWQRLTLESALRELWDVSGIPERFKGELRIEPLPGEPVPEVKALLYRGMQEALSNLVTHSKATRVDVVLHASGDRVALMVVDNGVGFDEYKLRSAPASVAAGIGLRSIREQVEGLGGNFQVESGPLGTKLTISVVMAPIVY